MIYENVPGREGSMAYNPFLALPRCSDYNMGSLLAAQPQYLHAAAGMAAAHLQHHPGMSGLSSSILPKLQQTVARSLNPADMFLGGHHIPRPLRTLEPPEQDVHDDPKVELESKELWQQFHTLGTEMVITKSGR
eukprot:GHVT01064327.1.p1 GENE.GHVT01064327.1~~GHVT01064327.1.p1  ORF type:complete len:134 (+),score=6.68 GHVT01064327.1:45-446(+)